MRSLTSNKSSRSGSIDSTSLLSSSPSQSSMGLSAASSSFFCPVSVSRAFTASRKRRESPFSKWSIQDWLSESICMAAAFCLFWVKVWAIILGLFTWPFIVSLAYINAFIHHSVHAEVPFETLPLNPVEVFRLNKAIILFYFSVVLEGILKLDFEVILHFYNIKSFEDFKVIKDVQYSLDESDVTLDIYLPVTENHFIDRRLRPVMIFVYGGGWFKGHKSWYFGIARTFTKQGYIVVIPQYSDYPTRIENVLGQVQDSFQWTYDHIHEFGGDKSEISLVGHSAGAHMIAFSVIKGFSDLKPPAWTCSLQSIILLGGLFDISEHFLHEKSRAVHKISKMARVFGKPETWPWYSPKKLAKRLHHSRVKMEGRPLPLWLIVHGDQDITVPISSSFSFLEALKRSIFNSYPGALSIMTLTDGTHYDPIFALISERAPFYYPLFQKLSAIGIFNSNSAATGRK